MGIDIYLQGDRATSGASRAVAGAARWLDEVEAWLRERTGDRLVGLGRHVEDTGKARLSALLHPSAERVDLTVAGRQVSVAVRTSTVGPGYHQYVCDLLHELGRDLDFAWRPEGGEDGSLDETGYFGTRDETHLRGAMLEWLTGIARISLEHGSAGRSLAINMPLDVSFETDAMLTTPMGPRDRTWVESVAAEPESGADVFPWWEFGQGAGYCTGRALTQMWCNVRWRAPLIDAERKVIDDVLSHLERAYRSDPTLNYPWPEWLELLNYVDRSDDLAETVAELAARVPPDRAAIGYRRRDVVTRGIGGGWQIRIPGALIEDHAEDGAWYAWDESRRVRVSALAIQPGANAPLPSPAQLIKVAPDESDDVLTLSDGPRVGRASMIPRADAPDDVNTLFGRTAVPGKLAICTIYFVDQVDRAWAERTWRSLDVTAGVKA